MCKSVRQMPVGSTLMRTSLMPIVGRGMSSSQSPTSAFFFTSASMVFLKVAVAGVSSQWDFVSGLNGEWQGKAPTTFSGGSKNRAPAAYRRARFFEPPLNLQVSTGFAVLAPGARGEHIPAVLWFDILLAQRLQPSPTAPIEKILQADAEKNEESAHPVEQHCPLPSPGDGVEAAGPIEQTKAAIHGEHGA